jgi:membrane associated rhomboid family serine protease
MRALLTINVVVYVLASFSLLFGVFGFWRFYVALNTDSWAFLYMPWQFVTYNFLHAGFSLNGLLHVGFNMLWLYWIGKEYEELHGSHRLVALYLLTGVLGGVVSVLLALAVPTYFAGYVLGASASVLGVLTAVAILYPYKKIALFLFGTVRLIYIVAAFLVIDLLFNIGSGVAVGAHAGGALGGYLFAKAERSSSVDVTSWARVFFGGRKKTRRRSSSARRSSPPKGDGVLARLERWLSGATTTGEPAASADAPSRDTRTASGTASADEIDRILDKISEQGYDALSDEEKRKLLDASQSER